LAISSQPAGAQACSFTNTGLDFGNVGVATSNNIQTTGTFTATCTGTPNTQVRICANFNAGSGGANSDGSLRYMLQGVTRLAYNIYTNNGFGQVWGSFTALWNRSPRPPGMLLSLGANGTGTLTRTIYARLANNQTGIPTGTFLSSFGGNNTQIAYNYSNVQNCQPAPLPNLTQAPFIVRLTNESTCTVSATNLAFGSTGTLATVKTTTNSISVNCTSGALYEVGLSNGSSGGTGPTARKMSNTATTSKVTYGIYRDAAMSQPWGSTSGTDTLTATGTGAAQNYTGYGRVPVQTTPPPMTYTDNVVVTVTY
ncbi:MAG: spore coat U domain-containing protein, partial [Rhizobiales bacterium]|nr:spore coat U domain-containing protein [Hyphomicrobiales bacterium]